MFVLCFLTPQLCFGTILHNPYLLLMLFLKSCTFLIKLLSCDRQTEFERRYFFWVHPLTIFGEIANVWLLAKHGNNWDASDLILPIPNEWLFCRSTIRWTETVFQTGLSGGE